MQLLEESGSKMLVHKRNLPMGLPKHSGRQRHLFRDGFRSFVYSEKRL